MDRDEETDDMVQQAKALLEDIVSGSVLGGSNSETARNAKSVQAIGILLAALVLETRALRHSQELANRMIRAEQERVSDISAMDHRLRSVEKFLNM